MVLLGYNTNGFVHHRLEWAVPWLADLGYQAVALTPDVAHLDPARASATEVAAFGVLCARLGLRVVVESGARYSLDPKRKHRPNLLETDDSWRQRLEYLARLITWCPELGANVLSFWSGVLPEGQTPSAADERLREVADLLHPLAELHGVQLALEPEPGHFVGTLADFRLLDEPRLGLMLDVGHLLVNDHGDPARAIAEFETSILGVQLDDMRRGVHEHLAPGAGDVNWRAVADACATLHEDVTACFELSRDSHRFHEVAPAAIAAWRDAARR